MSSRGTTGGWITPGVVVAVVSGVAAFLHSVSRSRTGLAVWGAVSALAAVVALFLGVLLAQY